MPAIITCRRMLVVIILLSLPCLAEAGVHGRVYLDANGNGQFDAGEKPLAGCIVIDGEALVRTDIGGVTLGDQRPGSIRVLTRKEVGELYKAVGL